MLKSKKFISFLLVVLVTTSLMFAGAPGASAATNQFKGVNWADQRDNFQTGVIYVSGLSASDTYSTASTVADRVISQFMSLLGSNSVRMPINETTVSSYWGTYTGAIDKALSKGKVILCYWAPSNGKPADMTAFWNMWTTVVNKYGSNTNCYFEIINEPYGYSATDLCNLYNSWITRYTSVPQGRVILDGEGYAQSLSAVGGDSRLKNCLLAVHDYSFFVSNPYTTESAWQNHISGFVGSYADRTICTEWGGPMSPGSKNGVSYGTQNYNNTSGTFFVSYLRGISNQLRGWNMGSFYWPGLRDGDWYSMTTKSGSGSGITLTLPNASGLERLKYSWGEKFIKIRNAATNLCIDGAGLTADGSAAKQYASGGSNNQQWVIEGAGTYVKIKNRATGLYLDGAGSTTNGSVVKQYAASSSNNQQWLQEHTGNNVKFKNRATGLYLDGMGRTTDGSELAQYSGSSSTNQQWQILVP